MVSIKILNRSIQINIDDAYMLKDPDQELNTRNYYINRMTTII
jgi:hypothetical protein